MSLNLSFSSPLCPKLPWMIDFHTKNGGIFNGQWNAAFAKDHLENLCQLNIDSDPLRCRMTKIMCTLGPSSMDSNTITELMKAGANIFRLKMTHSSAQEAEEVVKRIRSARDKLSQLIGFMYNIAICFDLEGPGIRTGRLEDNCTFLEIKDGVTTTLTSNKMYEQFVSEDVIYVSCELIQEIVKPGDKVYLENGTIVLEVIEVDKKDVKCLVLQGGKLTNLSNLDIPGIPILRESITAYDTEIIELAVKLKIDMIVMSEFRSVENIIKAKELLGDIPGGAGIMLIPKIEFAINLDEFDEILALSDGILLSRERLRIEVSTEKLFLVQKMILAKCNKAGKPVICASSLLESMITLSRPLKAELIDVANSILDGSDCLVLSRETSIGDHPATAVMMIAGLALEAEAACYSREIYKNLTSNFDTPLEPEKAIVYSIVDLSMRCNAAAIIVCTVSGKSAKLISRYKPRCPIIAVTRYAHVAQKLNLWRGVLPFLYFRRPHCNWKKDISTRIQVGMTFAKITGIVRAGDAVVVVKALRQGSGFTNSMQIVYASEFDTLPPEKN